MMAKIIQPRLRRGLGVGDGVITGGGGGGTVPEAKGAMSIVFAS
jgi:hypothetical protein